MEMEQLTDLIQKMLHQLTVVIGVLPRITISTFGITISPTAAQTTTIRMPLVEFGQSELFNYSTIYLFIAVGNRIFF